MKPKEAKEAEDTTPGRPDEFAPADDVKQDRAGDFGNEGQFAPGGYYNQQGAAKPDRVDLDEELAPRRQLGNRR